MAIVINGIFRGFIKGVQGFESGARFGIDRLKWFLNAVGMSYPIIVAVGSLCGSLQLPVLTLTVLSAVAVSAQMFIAAMIGFYGGAFVGFAHGSWQILQGTLYLTRTIWSFGTGAMAMALGGVFRKSFEVFGGLFPFIHRV